MVKIDLRDQGDWIKKTKKRKRMHRLDPGMGFGIPDATRKALPTENKDPQSPVLPQDANNIRWDEEEN